MDERLARALGASAGLGALLALAAGMPSRWYGYEPTDAHVFDPALPSPLWIERTLVPLVSTLAGLLVLAGLAGLVARDRRVATRLRRWSGYVAVAGVALLVVTQLLLAAGDASATGGGDEVAGALLVLLALATGLVGLALAGAGLVAAGVAYARTDRPRIGYALAGGPLVAVLAGAVGFGLGVTLLGVLPVIAPLAATFVAVGRELWTHHDPLADTGERRPADGESGAGA